MLGPSGSCIEITDIPDLGDIADIALSVGFASHSHLTQSSAQLHKIVTA